VHDLDFVLPENAMQAARRVANALSTDFYALDAERDTARLIQTQPDGSRLFLDFAGMRGPDLQSDLYDRDFTINAMALDLRQPQQLIDPLGGSQDLRSGVIRACSQDTFLNDPLRTLRAVRQAIAFGYQMLPETRHSLRQALPLLPRVSVERLRDEIFRILDGPKPAAALAALEILGALPYTLPELSDLKGVSQSPPHTADVWMHTLGVVKKLTSVINILAPQHDPESASNWTMGLISLRLGRYRQQIHDHLTTPLNPDRSLRALILLAALYHDVAKPLTRQVDENGRIRFFEHDDRGSAIASARGNKLHLSNDEIGRLKTIVRYHMRPLLLAQAAETPTRRAIYRFFRSTGSAGVDICLLSLADTLATYGATLPQEIWTRQLDIIRLLLEAWWEKPQEQISPPPLLNGHALIETFNLPAGPQIGQILELIREAQAAGEIQSQEEALNLARAWLEKRN
jgi:poly(A) polymerase